jgi:uncharacterized membrane protein
MLTRFHAVKMTTPPKQRLTYIDWMRGLACLVMFQDHCYDSWLSDAARQSKLYKASQLGGTLPAPLFLFLAGISFALVADRLRRRDATPRQIAVTTIRRGAEILALGLLFRLQEYILGQPWAPWTDLLRVDILNTIGASIMLMGALCWIVSALSSAADAGAWRMRNVYAAIVAALAISFVSPLVWTSWKPQWLPWYLETYLDGVHNLGAPQPWLFPIFPWAAFAFAGMAVGFVILSERARLHEARTALALGFTGILVGAAALWAEAQPRQLYAVDDFWHTSPNFFLLRVGILLVILLAAYAWCRWGAPARMFSPLVQLGQTSLLVYWVHIEFVYGRLSILPKRNSTVPQATLGLLAIFVAMLVLSIIRTRTKGRGAEFLAAFRRSLAQVAKP